MFYLKSINGSLVWFANLVDIFNSKHCLDGYRLDKSKKSLERRFSLLITVYKCFVNHGTMVKISEELR